MAGTSWQLDDPLVKLRVVKLRVAASSCFFGEPMYYHRDPADKRPPRQPVRRRPATRLTDEQVRHLRDTLNAVDPREWRDLGPAELLEQAIDNALAFAPEATLQEATRLRTEEHIRTTPQVILVRAVHHPRVLRNLRNLLDHGVAPECFTDRLIVGAAEGKQLPFRYYSTYRAVLDGWSDGLLGFAARMMAGAPDDRPRRARSGRDSLQATPGQQ